MNWSLLVREGMRSANACDPPNESFFLFNKRSVAVSSRQRGRCQLDMVNKLLIPANLCGRSSPDRNARAGVGVRCSRERTHVQSPNSRCARLAGAVHRDDRHLDPGTGEFVTVVVVRPAASAAASWIRALNMGSLPGASNSNAGASVPVGT